MQHISFIDSPIKKKLLSSINFSLTSSLCRIHFPFSWRAFLYQAFVSGCAHFERLRRAVSPRSRNEAKSNKKTVNNKQEKQHVNAPKLLMKHSGTKDTRHKAAEPSETSQRSHAAIRITITLT